jgi:hypothetical protein
MRVPTAVLYKIAQFFAVSCMEWLSHDAPKRVTTLGTVVKNLTRCFSLDVAGRVDVLQARYYGRAFSPHWHEEYAIGLITGGVEQFEYRGATHRAGPGEIVLMDAGEIHTGESWDERGFAFRMLYIPESTFREAAGVPGKFCASERHKKLA